MNAIQFPKSIDTDLEQINAIIAERLRFRAEVERIAAPHAIRPASERFHAALVLLCARLGEHRLEQAMHAAAAVELIYAASSLHNTLVDELAKTTPSWKGNVGLMVGDYLYALAAAEMALIPDQRIIAYFSESVMAICEGQMAPVESVAPLSQALQQYRYATGRETAALYEAACKAGAVCGALESELVKTVGSYGYELGMALAIVRDVQQLRSRKPQTNLRITLPLIYAADESYPFSKRVSSAMLSEEQHAAILVETLQLGGDMRALADAQLHVEQACVALIDLPDSSARDELEALARSVVMEF